MRLPSRWGASALVAAAAGLVGYSAPDEKKSAHIRWLSAEKKRRDRESHARSLVERCMASQGIPGLSVAVSVNGKRVWGEGFGLADIETAARCTDRTVMRIASISKPITSTIAALLVDKGQLDLDAPIQQYVPDFPVKTWDNRPTQITTRMLLSHTSGIRHYEKKGEPKVEGDGNASRTSEFYSNKYYASISEAVKMFVDDELITEPGKSFTYTTHGYTLAAAVIEAASGEKFENLLDDLFRRLGMRHTTLDKNSPIINDRAKYYLRNKKSGILENTPEVDNSYKWAGGGILSNVDDLLSFGNALLYCNQFVRSSSTPAPLLSAETCANFWKGEIKTTRNDKYGLGWVRTEAPVEGLVGGAARPRGGIWHHTGGAVGASSVLLIEPRASKGDGSPIPIGVVVAILVNLQSTSVRQLAEELAQVFGDECE